jgi:ribose transport system substrate-binding protein
MKKLNFIVSLITGKNAYQQDQATAAREAARRHGAEVQILFAENDAVTQSQQLLKAIQSSSKDSKPDAIICHPAGTTLERVAQEAMSRGIGWALVNREGDYVADLRKKHQSPAFFITLDQEEIGRIQGRQFGALLPGGGLVMYIVGPSINPVFKLRLAGMQETKPANIQIITLRGNLTEESGYESVSSWLRLNTSRTTRVGLVAGQNDDMAMGARKAFEDALEGEERDRWSRLPYTGCDASSGAGQEWIRQGLLTASVFMPPTAGVAVETLVRTMQTKMPAPLRHQMSPVSYPALETLRERFAAKEVARP